MGAAREIIAAAALTVATAAGSAETVQTPKPLAYIRKDDDIERRNGEGQGLLEDRIVATPRKQHMAQCLGNLTHRLAGRESQVGGRYRGDVLR